MRDLLDYLESFFSKKKHFISFTITAISGSLSAIISSTWKISDQTSNLLLYTIPIVFSLLSFFVFDIWRVRILFTRVRKKELSSAIIYFKDLLREQIDKDFEISLLVKTGTSTLREIAHTKKSSVVTTPPGKYIDINKSVSGIAASQKRSIRLNIGEDEKEQFYMAFGPRMKSEIAIPIIDSFGYVVGVLSIESAQKLSDKEFTIIKNLVEKDKDMLQKVTKQIYEYEA